MFRKLVIGALGAMAVSFSTTAFAQQGTAADAKAMLERTVAAIKADKAKTLDQINKGEACPQPAEADISPKGADSRFDPDRT